MPAFRATVTEGRAGSVMCAYNAINGQPACANENLLVTHLRQLWGFQGYVVSDCDAVGNIYRDDQHHYTQTPRTRRGGYFQAGMDLICGGVFEIEKYPERGAHRASCPRPPSTPRCAACSPRAAPWPVRSARACLPVDNGRRLRHRRTSRAGAAHGRAEHGPAQERGRPAAAPRRPLDRRHRPQRRQSRRARRDYVASRPDR